MGLTNPCSGVDFSYNYKFIKFSYNFGEAYENSIQEMNAYISNPEIYGPEDYVYVDPDGAEPNSIDCSSPQSQAVIASKFVDAVLNDITATAELNGTISPEGTQTVAYGWTSNYTYTYTFSPDQNYVVDDVYIDGGSAGALESYAFSGVTEDHLINVTFARAIRTVTFDSQGGSDVAPTTGILSGSTISEPDAPIRDGLIFNGWYLEPQCTNRWDFESDEVTEDITLYAGWSVDYFLGTGGNNDVNVIVNGQIQNAGTRDDSTNGDGKTESTIIVDSDKLKALLDAAGQGALVILPIDKDVDVANGILTGEMVHDMENLDATLQIRTDSTIFTIPASEFNIAAISEQFGTDVDLSKIVVTVQISQPSDAMGEIVENAAAEGGYELRIPAVEFTITCTYEGQTVEIKEFNSYVQRMVEIPEGVDPADITTAVVVGADGTSYHVPTYITEINGKYYAVISSLTDSVYAVVWHSVAFADAAGHWAQDAINDMGSRMVFTGVTDTAFEPDRNITRAEFAAAMVRALGLAAGSGVTGFKDVPSTKWYAGYIETAYKYGIINGYSSDTFGPDDSLTREQAMAIIARAMGLTGLTGDISGVSLTQYGDASSITAYAPRQREGVCFHRCCNRQERHIPGAEGVHHPRRGRCHDPETAAEVRPDRLILSQLFN